MSRPHQSIVRSWCLAVALLTILMTSSCKAQDAINIIAKAMLCFNNQTVYGNCNKQFRLTVNGTLNIPKNSTKTFCDGPCMDGTNLILTCLDGILSNFQFYNGYTVLAVRDTIGIACGNTTRRGGGSNVSKNVVASTEIPPSGLPTVSHADNTRREFGLGLWAALSLIVLLSCVL